MAVKKSTTAQSRARAQAPGAKGLTQTQRWAYGMILLFFALFILVSVVSFYFHWAEDQSVAQWSSVFDSEAQAANKGGKLGAVLGYYMVAQWFGIFGVCIPAVLIVLALRIIRNRRTFLRRSVRVGLILMILGSLVFGYLFGESWHLFGTGLGGAHGIVVARWLESLLGGVGTGLLLLLAVVIFAVYINRNVISYINRFGKEVVDNGKKVGGAVTSTAAGMIRHEGKGRAAEPAAGKQQRGEEEKEAAGSAQTLPGAEDKLSPPAEDGFFVHGPDGGEPDDDGPDGIICDEDGFVIVDPAAARREADEAPAAGTEHAVRGIEVDEDGFVITNLAPDLAPDAAPGGGAGREPVPADPFGAAAGDISGGQSGPAAGEEAEGAFVAHVPGSIDLGETDASQITVARLPEEEVLGEEQIDNTLYDPTLELSSYQLPPVELLEDHSVEVSVTSEEIVENKNRIKDTLENFGIRIDKIKATIGPTVTLYEIVPAPGVRISKIKNLEDDIALSLSALGIRIIAPIPGKGTIGIEVPNKDKKVVSMSSVIRSAKFQESSFDLPVVLGKTIQDETFVIDLAKMPHLLVAGATGQGKSVGLNAIITSLLYRKHPAELKLVLVDPKKVELTLYSKLERHFLAKMPGEEDAIITDTHKVIYTLNSLCVEMDARYDLLRKAEVRHVKEYNDKFTRRRLNPNKGHRFLPYIIVIIDEFADLIMTAGREVETPIARIAQLARAVGIHLVIATQRPTTNIITGVIKANFPARIAFRVTSMIDSRTIIDQPGANQLIGRGDMLVSTGNELIRVQCAFVDTPEIERITEFIGNQRGYLGAYELPEYVPEGGGEGAGGNRANDLSQLDAMFEEVARFVVQNQQGSTSSIQRRFSIGYNRAGRIMDQLEMSGIVGRAEGSKPREVLITDMLSLETLLSGLNG